MIAHAPGPEWAVWNADARLAAWTVGIEEEVMLLGPGRLGLASGVSEVLLALPVELARSVRAETHGATLELATQPHATVRAAVAELAELRLRVAAHTDRLDLRMAAAGTHPFAVWQEIQVSEGARYRFIHESVRELARREPTFAMHVHVGVPAAELAVRVANRLRTHLPVLLALSANSPFWQGRDSGMASVRTPVFQSFPRVGIPRAFPDYAAWVRVVDALIPGAIPEPTFLWWDVRLQPRLGTVEVRILDAQTTLDRVAALAALVQSLARMETAEETSTPTAERELLDENRFLAARDGVEAELLNPAGGPRVPARELVEGLLAACGPHARDLDCVAELGLVRELLEEPSAELQRACVSTGGMDGLMQALCASFPTPPSGVRAGAVRPSQTRPRPDAQTTAGEGVGGGSEHRSGDKAAVDPL